MVSRLTGCRLHDHNCGFKLYRSEVVREVEIYGELHRFVPVLAHARGFRVAEIEVNHRPRRHGTSKYGCLAVPQGLPRPPDRPVPDPVPPAPAAHPGGRGPGAAGPGRAGTGLPGRPLDHGRLDSRYRPIGNRPMLFYSIALLIVGVQLLSLGILAELVTAYSIRPQDTYSIAETIETRADGSGCDEPAARKRSRRQNAAPGRRREHDALTASVPGFDARRRRAWHHSPPSLPRARPCWTRNPNSYPRRSEPRRFVALIVIVSTVALALGVLLRQPSMMGANDISRWCTVWSLLERGTYIIDECPWQVDTQDKVYRPQAARTRAPSPSSITTRASPRCCRP